MAGIVALVGVWVCLPWRDYPFVNVPDPSHVQAMTAKLVNSPRKLPDLPTFDVSPEHVPIILSTLRPARRDWTPAPWQILGELRLVCEGNKTVEVHLFWTGKDTGAFAIGPWGKQVYFLGGTDQAIEDAIRDAYAAAQSKQERK